MRFKVQLGALLAALILSGATCVVTAEQLPVMPLEASVEANQVTLSLNQGEGNRGTLSAVGCSGCPLYFDFDPTTLFTLNGEPVSLLDANAMSGTAGTLIFERDTRRLLRVVW